MFPPPSRFLSPTFASRGNIDQTPFRAALSVRRKLTHYAPRVFINFNRYLTSLLEESARLSKGAGSLNKVLFGRQTMARGIEPMDMSTQNLSRFEKTLCKLR